MFIRNNYLEKKEEYDEGMQGGTLENTNDPIEEENPEIQPEELIFNPEDNEYGFKDANELFRNYVDIKNNLTNKYEPLEKEYGEINSFLKENGIGNVKPLDILSNVFGMLNDENSHFNIGYQINQLMDNPSYKSLIERTLNEIGQQEITRRYGSNLTEDQILERQNSERKMRELEEKVQAFETQKIQEEQNRVFKDQMNKIVEHLSKHQIQMNENQLMSYLQQYRDSGKPLQYLFTDFIHSNYDTFQNTERERIKNEVIAELEKSRKKSVLGGGGRNTTRSPLDIVKNDIPKNVNMDELLRNRAKEEIVSG